MTSLIKFNNGFCFCDFNSLPKMLTTGNKEMLLIYVFKYNHLHIGDRPQRTIHPKTKQLRYK